MNFMKRMLHLLLAVVMLLSCFTLPTAMAEDTVTVTMNVSNCLLYTSDAADEL